MSNVDQNKPAVAVPVQGGKSRLLTLDSLDRRTAAYRRTQDLIGAIVSDLGGDDHLSTAEKQVAQRAALMGTVLESMETQWLSGGDFDAAAYCTLSNAQRRLFETVGLQRRPRDVGTTLEAYLKSRTSDSQDSIAGHSEADR